MKVTQSSLAPNQWWVNPSWVQSGLASAGLLFQPNGRLQNGQDHFAGGLFHKRRWKWWSFIEMTRNGPPVRMRMDPLQLPHILHWSDFEDVRLLYCSCHTTFYLVIRNLEFVEGVPHFKIFYRVNPRQVCRISKINMWWNHARSYKRKQRVSLFVFICSNRTRKKKKRILQKEMIGIYGQQSVLQRELEVNKYRCKENVYVYDCILVQQWWG